MTDLGAVAADSLDAFPAQLAILDDEGVIVYTNRAWREFGEANALRGDPDSTGVNYLEVCEPPADDRRGTPSEPEPREPEPSESGPDEPGKGGAVGGPGGNADGSGEGHGGLGGDGLDAADARDGAVAADGIHSVIDGECGTFEFEYPCHGPHGERWFTMRASRFEHGGESYVLVLHLDITARKLAERATQQRAARLRNVAQVLSHDLRNPLAVASGFADLLGDDLGADDRLERLETALDRMDRIIEDALVLAREETVDDADLLPVSLADAASQAWETVDTQDATLRVDDSLAFVANPTLLRHVFENLFRNAVEHAGTDVTVTVGAIGGGTRSDGAPADDATDDATDDDATEGDATEGDATEGDATEGDATEGDATDDDVTEDDVTEDDVTEDGFFVEDDGPGIPPDARDDVFESGFTTAEQGTGLGLSIVTRIVDAHGWDCRIADAEHADSGARFEVTGVERRDG